MARTIKGKDMVLTRMNGYRRERNGTGKRC